MIIWKANTTALSLKKGNTIAFKFREWSLHSIADYDYKSLALDMVEVETTCLNIWLAQIFDRLAM